MPNRRFGVLSSSEDPTKLADTVKGLIIGAGVLIIYLARLLGFEITTEQITNAAIVIGTAISSVWVAYGLLKKVVIALFTKFRS